MRILIDIAHPANVHYFKNFIFEMKKRKHEILITARDKDVTLELLKIFNLEFINIGTGSIGKGILGKILYIFYADIRIFFIFLKFRPEIAVSFSSSHTAHNSFLFRIPHITFEDTEHARMNMLLYKPFSKMILTPSCFYSNLGKNHFRFNSYMELFYLHEKRFQPDKSVLKDLMINTEDPFVLLRIVSWEAFHDIGERGLSLSDIYKIIEVASRYAKIFISSEKPLPDDLKKFAITLKPNKIHDILYFAKLYIGEGGTMASEAAMLGTPAIYVNSLPLMGYLKDAEQNNLLFHLREIDSIVDKMIEILSDTNSKNRFRSYQKKMCENKIDATSFLIWLVENYPNSKKILLNDPNYEI